MAKRVNYLNNKDLLLEIHKSKLSYCWFLDEKYSGYNVIIGIDDEITDEIIQLGKEDKAKKMEKRMYEDALIEWEDSGAKRSQKPTQNQCKMVGKPPNVTVASCRDTSVHSAGRVIMAQVY